MKDFETAEEFLAAFPQWEKELKKLHKILKDSRLVETIKWGAPVYTTKDGKNIVGLAAFKSYVGLWFYQGALLRDPAKKLVTAEDGNAKAMMQWRFRTLKEVDVNVKLVKVYIKEAIANSKDGKEIKPVKKAPLKIPAELKEALDKNKGAKAGYDKLTTFKKREYCDFIIEAKREATKANRLKKILPMLKKGIGLHDKYRK
ncbi:MAG: hypothetical protein HKN75_08480 [Bacteroidia bacterium]|nr:hypothetical protein [Bacteroidia bacterium]